MLFMVSFYTAKYFSFVKHTIDLFFYDIIKLLNLGGALLSTKQKVFLESKLMAFKACYQQAESKKDQNAWTK